MPNLFTAQSSVNSEIVGPRADAAAFGGGEALARAGQDISEAGDQVAEIFARKQNRVDAVARAKGINEYTNFTNDEFLRVQTEEDITSPSTLATFGAKANDRMREILDKHEGSQESKMELQTRLDGVRSAMASTLSKASNKESRKIVGDALTANFGRIAAVATATGDIKEAYKSVDSEVDGSAGALSPSDEQAQRMAGRSIVLRDLFFSRMDTGDTAGGAAILATPGAIDALGADKFREMRTSIAVAQRGEQKGAQEAEQELAKVARILGIPVSQITPAQRLVLAGLKPDKPDKVPQTPAEKLALVEEAVSAGGLPPLTPEAKVRVLTGFAQGQNEAKFTAAGVRTTETNIAARINSGEEVSDADKADFITATTVITQPQFVVDPDGSVVKTPGGVLTQAALNALGRMGVDTTGKPIVAAQPGAPGGSPEPSERGKLLDSPREGELPIPREETVWGASFSGTGIKSAVQGGFAKLPGVGETAFGRNEKVAKARQTLDLMQNELVAVLRLGERANQERIELKKELSIGPQDIESPTRYRDRLLAIDAALRTRSRKAFALLAGGTIIGREQRAEMSQFAIKAHNFAERLGVPPQFKDYPAARAAKLPPGTEIIVNGAQTFVGGGAK